MATHSTITIYTPEDEMVHSIYCHSDGYLDHNGRILLENYTTREQVEDLISLGDLSYLDTTTATTSAYSRDRGEQINIWTVPAAEYVSGDNFEEYNYLFVCNPGTSSGAWFVWKGKELERLTKENTAAPVKA